MTEHEVYAWLQTAPLPGGGELHPDFLPSFDGWSFSLPEEKVRTDILGTSRTGTTLRVTRRGTVTAHAERLLLLQELSDFAGWACANPPAGTRVSVTARPRFAARSASAVEDFSLTLCIQE